MVVAALFDWFIFVTPGVVLSFVVSAADVACVVVAPAVVGLVKISSFSLFAAVALLTGTSQWKPCHPDEQLQRTDLGLP